MKTSAEVLAYVDTSALTKFIVAEPGTVELRDALAAADLVSSALAKIELRRATLRLGHREALRRADALIERVALVTVDDAILDVASRLEPPTLRSLDALHLATALGLAAQLDTFVSYDHRLTSAAMVHGLEVSSPGVP